MNADVDKNLVRRYLLGTLPEDEQVTLEAEYFADNEKFEQVWALENELVDEYVRGRLSGSERQLFEKNYLRHPKHRSRVLTAQQLLAAADAQLAERAAPVTSIAPAAESFWQKLQAFFRPPQLAWAGALLLLVVLGGWWLFQPRDEKEPQIATGLPTPSREPSPVATLPPASVTPTPTLSPTPTAPPKASPATTAAPSVLAFMLLNPITRSEDKIQRLTIPAATKQVRLQVKVSDQDYPRYQAKLRSAEGRDLLTQTVAKPTTRNQAVAVTIPAQQLPPGDYFLVLSGLSQDNEAEELSKYFFRVNRK